MTTLRIEAFGLPMSEMLGEIAKAEDDAGRGLLTVIVVHEAGDQSRAMVSTRWRKSAVGMCRTE